MTQEQAVFEFLKKHGSITSLEAFKLGCTRLSAVILRFRQRGFFIETKIENCQTRYGTNANYARYFLKNKENENGIEMQD